MSTDRHDPLDADERELARVLRALPAGEPPSALDARILAMARDAVVTTPAQTDEGQPRARRAPRLAWGLGVAASCVLAAGLVWRMGGFGAESLDVVGTELREEMAAPAASAEPMVPPPPPPAPAAAVAPAMVAAAPAAEARPDVERRREQSTMRPAPEPAPDATGFAHGDAAEAPATLDRISVSGARVSDVGTAAVVAEDSRAGPQIWIQRIRARIERGDTEGARQSLEGFIGRYPRKPLPQDLIDFGQSAGIDGLVRDDG
ncbi:hypothetical protein GCM10028794_00990 [Silanimonas algicola]